MEVLTEDQKFWVVGIGASAGGLEALQAFVGELNPGIPATYVIAQHLSPHAKSMLVELLARHCRLPVSAAKNNMKLRQGNIYVVPPNFDVDFVDGRLRLTQLHSELRPKPSVNHFFQSLATAWGELAVGIILSGTGTDGSEGISRIRKVGGLTLAQDDGSARYDGMPRSAVDTGSVDIILPPAEMARELENLLGMHPSSMTTPEESMKEILPILNYVKEQTGTDYTQYKPSTVRRRVERQMRLAGQTSYPKYLEFLQGHPHEVQNLVQDTLISVTQFFRDADAFKELQTQFEKAWADKARDSELRIWVAGCATGEEAYSIAILVSEVLEGFGRRTPFRVFATDLDQEGILEARTGIYSAREVENVPRSLREKYFVPRGESFEVRKTLREHMVFARQDLIQSAPFVKIDLITCRNVMIYFEPSLQRRVFELFHYALNPNGLLFLGKSEAANEGSNLFEPVERKLRIFKRANVVSRVIPTGSRVRVDSRLATNRRPKTPPPFEDWVHAEILRKFAVSGAVSDIDGNIVHVVGDISSYVKIPQGQISWNLSGMLPKSVGAELTVLLRRTQKERTPQRSRRYNVESKPEANFIIEVRPLSGADEADPTLFLVIFEFHPKIEMPKVSSHAGQPDQTVVSQLEQDLMATREHLQTVIEELGISNEELQSLNEELSSTNEELQSSNEELETANEELQSGNEELTTLNEELVNKSSELKSANAILENVQNSIGSPLVLVDADLRIQRYNAMATRLFELSPAELGRDITRVSCQCEIENFRPSLVRAIDSGKPIEIRVESFSHLYQLRIQPSFNENNRVDGAVLIFFDNTDLIRAEERLRSSESRIRSILESSPNPIWMKDTIGRYLLVNDAFLNFFAVKEDEIIGKTDREIFAAELAGTLREGDLEVLYKRSPRIDQERIKIPGQNGSTDERILTVSRFPLMDEQQKAPYAIGTVALDVTPQTVAQEALKRSEARYRAIVEDQAVFVCRLNPKGEFTFVNRSFCGYFGGEAIDYIGKSFLEVAAKSDRHLIDEHLREMRAQAPIFQFEHRRPRNGGQDRWIRWILKAIFEGDKLEEIQAVGFDITESRQETTRLQQREHLFRNVFDHSTDYLSIYAVTADGDFVLEDFNRSANELHGGMLEKVRGQKIRSFPHVAEISRVYFAMRECLHRAEPVILDNLWHLPSGSKFLSTTLVPVFNNEGQVNKIATVTRDLTKYKTIEDELRSEKDRAELASRSKTDFLASMSHELRTPLNIVLGMAELLAQDENDAERARLVNSIQTSGRALLTLIEDILDLSKIEAGKLKLEYRAFKLHDVVHEVIDSFSLQASARKLKLHLEMDKQTEKNLWGDPSRIRQVLVNLLGNALKFTDKGGVTVHVRSVSTGATSHARFRVEVKDTGIGIPADQHDKIFQRFSQVESGTSRRYGGTGLGLAICQRLIHSMGGEIGFDSHTGLGSKFWFELELAEAKREPRTKRGEKPKQIISGKRAQVLVVDDNDDSRWLVNRFISQMGHEVDEAADGTSAIEKIKSKKFDLIFMDVQMPGLDGYQTTRKIRESLKLSDLPIIALTANAMIGDDKKCLDAGMNDHIPKPVDRELLQRIISKWSADEPQRTDH